MEARVLAAVPRHPAVVRLLAAFLSEVGQRSFTLSDPALKAPGSERLKLKVMICFQTVL